VEKCADTQKKVRIEQRGGRRGKEGKGRGLCPRKPCFTTLNAQGKKKKTAIYQI